LAYFRAPIPWTELVRRTATEIFADGCPGLAAQLAFYFLLALFPALLFVVALIAYLPFQPAFESTLQRLDAFAPHEVITLIRRQLDQIVTGAGGGILTFGIAGAIWSSSSAMTAIITALNRAYDIDECRPWYLHTAGWFRRFSATGVTRLNSASRGGC
jgi:membrane protein